MSIDWSDAPEGAEAACLETDHNYFAWYRRDAAGLVEQICEDAGVTKWTWMGGRKDFPVDHILRPRTTPKQALENLTQKDWEIIGLKATIAQQAQMIEHLRGGPTPFYTASRPGEVRHAEWAEIDLEAATWTTPAAKMKMRRDHSVPLSCQAVELLKSMLPITGGKRYVFMNRNISTAPIGTNYANSVMDSCGLTGKQSPHGFRHLFSTEMNGRGYNRDWIERQLAHADSSIIRDVYNHAAYLEQRRGMMQEWADLINPQADKHSSHTTEAPSRQLGRQ